MTTGIHFQFQGRTARLHSGLHALDQLPGEVEALGARRAFVISTRSLERERQLLERALELLGDRHAGAFTGAAQESPLAQVLAGANAARNAEADLLVAIGGGSAVVTARAINLILCERADLRELCIRYPADGPPIAPPLEAPKLPMVVIPTTPTTAADTAGIAVTDDAPPYRMEFQDPAVRPAAVILDGQALSTPPVPVFLDTSLTLLGGLVVYLQSPELNPFSLADHREALDLTLSALPRLPSDPDDAAVRLELGIAALLCNRAWDAPDVPAAGITLGLQRQLRYRYDHVLQGAVGCVLHLAEMRLHREYLLPGQVQLARYWGVHEAGMSDAQAAQAVHDAFAALLRELGAPTRLRQLDIPEADLAEVARLEAARQSSTTAARRMAEPEELEAFLRGAW